MEATKEEFWICQVFVALLKQPGSLEKLEIEDEKM